MYVLLFIRLVHIVYFDQFPPVGVCVCVFRRLLCVREPIYLLLAFQFPQTGKTAEHPALSCVWGYVWVWVCVCPCAMAATFYEIYFREKAKCQPIDLR